MNGLFINSLGVSLITKADLGTSPISSIPYVLSLNFPMTLGQFTIFFQHSADSDTADHPAEEF